MLEDYRPLLLAQGFTEGSSAGLMAHAVRGFSRSTSSPPWNIGAHWSATLFEREEHVDLVLETSPHQEPIGTHHRVLSAKALRRDLSGILQELEGLAADPDKLKCPVCNERFVVLKEPAGSKQFTPFLSCQGMRRARGRVQGQSYKYTPCKGTSRRIPALVIHK